MVMHTRKITHSFKSHNVSFVRVMHREPKFYALLFIYAAPTKDQGSGIWN